MACSDSPGTTFSAIHEKFFILGIECAFLGVLCLCQKDVHLHELGSRTREWRLDIPRLVTSTTKDFQDVLLCSTPTHKGPVEQQ